MESKKVRDWLEIGATFAVLAGLLLVVQEIRVNTKAVALQAAIDTSAALTDPFFQSAELHSASQKIHDIDGAYAPEAALIQRYDLSPEEAIVWSRHLLQIWILLEATYEFQDKETAIRHARVLLLAPDNRAFVENYAYFDAEFEQILRGLISELDDSGISD
jgi:hypothetical protein